MTTARKEPVMTYLDEVEEQLWELDLVRAGLTTHFVRNIRALLKVARAAERFDKAATVTPDMCWAPVMEMTDEGGHVDEMPCGKCEPCTLADLRESLNSLSGSEETG